MGGENQRYQNQGKGVKSPVISKATRKKAVNCTVGES